MQRRRFLQTMAAVTAPAWALAQENARPTRMQERPNLVFVFADQWRAQATGYGGDSNLRTPHLDELAAESIDFRNAVASCPVCSPYRGSLLTGMYPDQHGVFVNDVHLRDEFLSIGDQLQEAGYFTGWIGKWHVNGRGRSAFIPPEERQGFQLWMTMECTHDYNNSWYYKDTPEKLKWEGYDAFAQTRAATRFIAEYQEDKPFALFLSWGPPHNPYNTAPAEYRRQFEAAELVLRGNVPADHEAAARLDLADYYAHCAALDACLGEIMQALRAAGLEENTVLVFTSDHGDMLESQGEQRKQRPWDESIRVPFLLRWPGRFGRSARTIEAPLGTPDLMPTLLELCHASVPDSVQGQSLVPWLEGAAPEDRGALIACYTPFGEWTRAKGGREYRGIRTRRYSYVCDLNGPWLLYDNDADPFQLKNLCGAAGQTDAQTRLDMDLKTLLRELGDEFLPGDEYLRRWGYKVDATGTVPYKA